MAEVMADQAAGLRRLISRDFVRVIAITSACPGAGTTFVARYLAASLAALGRDALSLGTDLPGRAQRDGAGLAASLERERQGAEITLVEVGRTSNDRQARIASCAPDVILVVGQEQAGLRDTYLLIKRILSFSSKCRLHVLVNRSSDTEYAKRIFGNLSTTSERFLRQPLLFLGELPNDERLSHLPRNGDFLESHPHSPLANMLRALAERILLWPYPGENDMSGFARRLVAVLPVPPAY